MARLSKAGIGFNGLVESISTSLQEWHPGILSTQTAYSNALAEHLRLTLPEDARVEREYRHEGTTCDLCIRYTGLIASDMLMIEVKRNLRRKSDYDRLVGQVEGLKPRKNKILVILVGETDPALLGRLREQFKDYEGFGESTFKIVVVT